MIFASDCAVGDTLVVEYLFWLTIVVNYPKPCIGAKDLIITQRGRLFHQV